MYLPRLSSALGIGATEMQRNNCVIAENGASSSVNSGNQAVQFEACDEDQNLCIMEDVEDQTLCIIEDREDQRYDVVGEVELRRSERERKATRRFQEGWFFESLPMLSSALGVTVGDGRNR